MDHLLASKLGSGSFVRYCDDLLVFDDDPERLRAAWDAVRARCDSLRLRLHPRKCGLRRTTEPISFLGFVLQRRGRAVTVRLRPENVRRMRARMAELRALYAIGAIEPEEVTARVRAWLAHARHGHTRELCWQVLEELSFAIVQPLVRRRDQGFRAQGITKRYQCTIHTNDLLSPRAPGPDAVAAGRRAVVVATGRVQVRRIEVEAPTANHPGGGDGQISTITAWIWVVVVPIQRPLPHAASKIGLAPHSIPGRQIRTNGQNIAERTDPAVLELLCDLFCGQSLSEETALLRRAALERRVICCELLRMMGDRGTMAEGRAFVEAELRKLEETRARRMAGPPA